MYSAAEAVLRRAVALAPDLAQARFALGTTLVRLGRGEEGREQLAEFQRLRNAELEAKRRTFELEKLLRDAELHASAGRLEAAVDSLEKAAAMKAEPGVYRDLASLYAKLGRPEQSARAGHIRAARPRVTGEAGDCATGSYRPDCSPAPSCTR